MHAIAMILALGTVGANDFTVTTLGSGGGVPQTLEIDTQLHLGDGVPLSFGGTSGDPDVWMDDNGTTWCFTTTDFDGGGTDSDLLCYTLGSNALTLGITSIDSTSASLDLDLVDNDPSALSINASGLAGMLVFDTTDDAEQVRIGTDADSADFPNARVIISQADSLYSYSVSKVGLVTEAVSDATLFGTGLIAAGRTSSTRGAVGTYGICKVNDTNDPTTATGANFYAYDAHVGGNNIAIALLADNGAKNMAIDIYNGDINTRASIDWDLKDNIADSFSIDTDGLSCLLCFDTTNSAEKISTGATLELGAALDANGNDILDGSGSLSLNDDVVVSGDLTVGGDTKLSTPADGDLLIANNAGTQGVVLDTASTDGALTLKNEGGSIGADIVIGAHGLYFGAVVTSLSARVQSVSDYLNVIGYYGAQFKHIGDLTTVSRGLFEFGQGSANYELTASSGVQYGMSLGNTTVPFEVDQSGTAGYHALHIDVTETATGSGEKHLINVGVGGASKFSIDNGGEVSASGISGDGSGKAVCIKADGNLGTCTDAVGAGGTCTCN